MTAFLRNSAGRKLILFSALFLLFPFLSKAVVTVTAPSTLTLCSGTAQTIGAITIAEGNSTDFTNGNNLTYVISAPAGFQFDVAGMSTSLSINYSGLGISSAATPIITTSTLTLTYSVNTSFGFNFVNSITINGIRISGATIGTQGNLLRTGGTAIQNGNAAGLQIHGTVRRSTSTAPPTPTISGPSPVCPNAINQYTSTAGSMPWSTFSWSAGGTPSIVGNLNDTVTMNWATPGAYTVFVSESNGCTTSFQATRAVTVRTPPTVSATQVCSAGNAVLTATGAVSYVWSPSTGLSSTTGASVTADPANITTYTVVGN
jgi:hypothetical protein